MVTDDKKNAFSPQLGEVVKGASISASGNIMACLIGFVSGIVIARILGTQLLGVYALTLSVVNMASVFAIAGLNRGVLHFIPVFRVEQRPDKIKGLIIFIIKPALILSLVTSAVLFALSDTIATSVFEKPYLAQPIRFASFSIVFLSLGTMFMNVIQGFKKLHYQVLQRVVVQPLSMLLLVVVFSLIGWRLYGALAAYLISMVAFAAAGFYFVKRIFPYKEKGSLSRAAKKEILLYSLPLFLNGILQYLIRHIDILMVGYFGTGTDVGIYRVAFNGALLITLPLASFNAIFAPIIAELFHSKKIDQLEHLFKVITKWVFTIGLPASIVLCYFGKNILAIYGKEFQQGAIPMAILAFGQLVNVSVGSVGWILVMTKRTKTVLFNSLALCILSIVTNLILIPKYGIIGAAIATCISLSLINVLRLVEVYCFLKIHPYKLSYLKPVAAGIISIGLVMLYNKLCRPLGVDVASYSLIFAFGIAYAFFIFLFRLDEEDRYVLNAIKRRITNGWGKR